jgi:hypothetical protein
MKNLDFNEMESVQGGELTKEEVNDFLGAASCALSVISPNPFTIAGCINWLW